MGDFRVRVCLVFAASLSACNEAPTPEWLSGAWVVPGHGCDSGAPYIFEPTGMWSTEGLTGTWRIIGDVVTINVTGQLNYDGSEPYFEPSNEKIELAIRQKEENSFITKFEGDFRETKLTRCQ